MLVGQYVAVWSHDYTGSGTTARSRRFACTPYIDAYYGGTDVLDGTDDRL